MNYNQQFLPLLWGLGFLSPVAAIVCAGFFYAHHCRKFPNSNDRLSLFAYVFILLICAVIGYLVGLQYGITWACSSPAGGNLCGLVGFFIVGPVAAALAIFLISGSMVFLRGGQK